MNINAKGTAMAKADSRKIFRPMFRARWQNMQNIVNDTTLTAFVPESFMTYYTAYIAQWAQWSRGFVPALHSQDFFSTGMGYTICDIFARECMSGGYRLESSDAELKEFMSCVDEDESLTDTLNEAFFHANAVGNSLLVLTPKRGVNKDIHITALPITRVFFQIGRKGNITYAMVLNRFTAGKKSYFARETRIMNGNKPFYKVELIDDTVVTSPSWGGSSLKVIPKSIKEQWANHYGDIDTNTFYKLPFKGLGLYNIKNKSVAVAISDMPGYADSSLHTALDILYSIDYNYTQQQVDMYLGKGRGLVPKEMQAMNVNGGKNIAEGLNREDAIGQAPLEDIFYNSVSTNSIDGKPIQPTFMQADMRGAEHKLIRDSDLELLSSKVGLSSSTLANHLSYNTSKTATEVRSEQDTTEKSVNNKRKLANRAINAMLNDIAKFYGFSGRVEIVWGRAGVNSSVENQELLADYQAGLLSMKQYLEKRWNDKSPDEINSMYNEIMEERKANSFSEQMEYQDTSFAD